MIHRHGMIHRLRPSLIALILFLLCLGHVTSYAQSVPRLLHYDGRLFVDGNPAFGSFEVTFSIYGTAQGGQALWSETQNVEPADGQFSVLLGSENPLPPDLTEAHNELYLAIQVENEAEMAPRLFMASTTFALHAGIADSVGAQSIHTASLADAAVTSTKLSDGSVTTLKLADAAITGAKLSEGAVVGAHLADGAVTAGKIAADAAVVSLNDQTGPVSLSAGSNVSIVEADGTITISSAGGNGGSGGDITAVLAGEGLAGGGDQGDVMLSLADGAVDASKLADAAVTSTKLAPGAAVTSLNNQNGALTLAAGTNVNIEEDDGTFTISASGGLIGGGDITAVNAGSGLTGGGETGDVTLAVDEEGVTTEMLANEAVTSPKLGDGAVSLAKLASDAAVTRLNSQSGSVTLAAGDNVNIEQSDGTITISSTASGGAVGDITAVNAGEGLEGGGQTGSVTLAIADNGVTTAKLMDAAVTGAKLASDAAVLSLNSRSGAVDLAAGDNVSITESGQTITISADEGAGGDITSVTAGTGLTGGGETGDVSLSLDPTAAVTGVNGIPGAVSLAAGENVSISESDQTITISAEEGASGDITSVTAGTGLTGGGETGDVELSIADLGVATGMLADGAVTTAKLQAGAAVTSLNGIADDVNLVEGTDISITPSGGDIMISYVGTPAQTQSSRRWKTNIQPLTNAVDLLMRLRGVSFEWKVDGRDDIGLIAEEVGAVIPEIVVFEENGVDARTVNYSRLVSVLIEAVKAQQEELDARDGVIDEMMERLDRLERLAQASTLRSGAAQQASR